MQGFDQFVEDEQSLVTKNTPPPSSLGEYRPKEQEFDLADLVQPKRIQTEQSCSIIEQHLADKPVNSADVPFFNARQGAYTLQEEKPRHRLMCLLSAEGFNNTEIAAQLGYTSVHVNYVLKQPWALSFISKLLAEKGGNAVQEILQGAAQKAAEHLCKTIDDTKVPASVRAKCANDILDRVFGRAQQIVLHGSVDPTEMTDEELAKLASQKQN